MNKKKKILYSKITDYARQTCICGHSVILLPSTEYIICNHCGRKIKNKTKGHFIHKMLKLTKGDKNGE